MMQLLRRCAVLFLVALAVSVASNASAGTPPGINLAWNDCSSAGATDKTIACTTNNGSSVLVASLVASAGLDSVLAITAVVDFTTATDPLPSWWNMQTGGCRAGSVSGSFAFGTFGTCVDFWNGQGLGISDYQIDNILTTATASPTNHSRFKGVCGQGVQTVAPMTPGTEYYMCAILINNAKTVGGACPGCATPACINLNVIETYQPNHGVPDQYFYDPPPGGNTTVTWQGGAGVNCASIPVKNKTWGQVKSLYR